MKYCNSTNNIIPCTQATATIASADDAASLNTSTLDTQTIYPIQEYEPRFLDQLKLVKNTILSLSNLNVVPMYKSEQNNTLTLKQKSSETDDTTVSYGNNTHPGSSVGIVTGYGLDGPGIEHRWGLDFPHLFRPALGSTQPPVKWGLSFPGVESGRGIR
jgi:hypothetical protein